jgi:NitT/TauT family transport system substrate-binding protein
MKKLLLTLCILGLAGLGTYNWLNRLSGTGDIAVLLGLALPEQAQPKALVVPMKAQPQLGAPGIFVAKNGVIEIELSQYAGYAGLIVANGGLEPNEDSTFFKKHGFKVRLTVSEEESWASLNAGRLAASATTSDVLAVYGRSLQVTVPAQIGWSRGADGIIVRKDIHRINDLKGRTVVTSQYTEADFFLRYLAQEAGLSVDILADLNTRPNPDRVNVVYAADAFAAGDLFLEELDSGANRLAGCVTWAPKTTDIVDKSKGGATLLVSNTNLLIIADILIVNRGFATANPKIVEGLVEGLLEGNRAVRDNEAASTALVGRAFQWTAEKTKAELAKVHLANLPENVAFFGGGANEAGSFDYIYQSALLAYGHDLIRNTIDPGRLVDLGALKALQIAGGFAAETIEIAPIRTATRNPIEGDPLLSKDIRFQFEPNSFALDLKDQANMDNLASIKKLLQISPGSTVVLRGHVDNGQVDAFRRQGGDQLVREMALSALELSKNRAKEIKNQLVDKMKVDPGRLETIGRGWEEPLGTDGAKNRRVEAQWFTLE